MEPNDFNRSKSALKALEYGNARIPVIAASVGEYASPGVGRWVRLVDPVDPEAWTEAVAELAGLGKSGIRSVGILGEAVVCRERSIAIVGPMWAEAVEAAAGVGA